jgi:amino acid transporter
MEHQKLPRTLGLWSSVALLVGITIGSGIFRSPAGIAQKVPNPVAMLLLWAGGGAITLCGALSLAELAAALPETGGLYAYLREGWGRLAAFLFGWSELVLIRANALGGIAVVFGEYLLSSLGIDPVEHYIVARSLSALAIAFAAGVNIRGANVGALIVGIATWAKFTALAVLAGAAFVLGSRHGASAAHLTTGTDATLTLGSMGLALVSILWAYDGWADLSFASGEVKDPHRNLPLAIILGTTAIIGIYLATNVAYLYVNPIETVARSRLIAADTMLALFGETGVALVSVFVMISSFSSLNGSMLASPRVFFAMADDGLFFERIARVHPRYKTPHVAILLAGLLGMALVLSRSFEALTDTFVLAIWPFYALGVAAIYRLRRLRPDLPRPYHAIGYPVVPAIFVIAVAAFVINALINEPLPTSITIALIFAGVPVYRVAFASRRTS